MDDVFSISPIDLWPIQNTSSFELKPGTLNVPPDHPAFHENHRDVGPFPGTEHDRMRDRQPQFRAARGREDEAGADLSAPALAATPSKPEHTSG